METKTLEERLKFHIVDSTAMVIENTSFFAFIEKGIVGTTTESSLNARLLGCVLTYAGLGEFFSWSRDKFREKIGVTQKTNDGIQFVCDALYNGLFGLALSPPFYFIAGQRDPETIAYLTGAAIVCDTFNGALQGYAIDTFQDLAGLKTCERSFYPAFVRNQTPHIKKIILAATCISALGITAGIYAYFPDP